MPGALNGLSCHMTSPQAGGQASPSLSPFKVGVGWSLLGTGWVQWLEVGTGYWVEKKKQTSGIPSVTSKAICRAMAFCVSDVFC